MTRYFGALVTAAGEVEFSLWAPEACQVDVVVEGAATKMRRDETGLHHARLAVPVGAAYRYRIDGEMEVPDPASRAQSADVHGPSLVTDLNFHWQHADWRGRPWAETVIYELHVGAYGGFDGVTAQLPRLAALGVTAVELMPIADFPGRHNWGYDGVLPYAPDAAYGSPQALKHLIDTAHGLGLQVFLDVVYNHFGPDGNYLNVYAKSFFRADRQTPWGSAIDFRRPEVRDFFIGNALHWLRDYRFDGLRFDAVHAIKDPPFLLEMAAKIRNALPGRHVHLILENEDNDAELLHPGATAPAYDGQWADVWHHCAHVLLTGETDGYYADFPAPAQRMAHHLATGLVEPPGAPLPPTATIIYLQNHDQVGNRAFGERLRSLAHPEALRAAVALLLFTPQIPMIFMGEEFGESRPFLYFTDHHDELGRLVTAGRQKEFARFSAFSDPQTRARIPDANAASTFAAAVPQITDNDWTALYTTCLSLRQRLIMKLMPGCVPAGAVALSDHAVRAAWRMNDGSLLTVATNFAVAPTPCDEMEGELLYGPGLEDGMLPGFTTCLWRA